MTNRTPQPRTARKVQRDVEVIALDQRPAPHAGPEPQVLRQHLERPVVVEVDPLRDETGGHDACVRNVPRSEDGDRGDDDLLHPSRLSSPHHGDLPVLDRDANRRKKLGARLHQHLVEPEDVTQWDLVESRKGNGCDEASEDGWIPNKNPFELEETVEKSDNERNGTRIMPQND